MRLRNLKNKDDLIRDCMYLVYEPEKYKGNWSKVFKNDHPIHIEIGMGKGTFIKEMAHAFPDINFIGIEKFDGVVARAINNINEDVPSNLRIIKTDAINVKDIFDKEIDTIYLNFSDPWPKNRHAKRRLTSSFFLSIYDSVFSGKPHIIQKTDNIGLFASSIVSLSEYGYTIHKCSLDLHNEDMENYQTEYEKKFSEKGQKINYLDAVKE